MFEAGERDRAYRVADEVLSLDPFDYRASELRLAQLIDHESWSEARRLCLQLQTANAVSGWLWEQRCIIASGLRKGPELVESAEAWLRSEPGTPVAYVRLAEGHQLAGDHAAALAALDEGIAEHPDVPLLHVALGDHHFDRDDHASARRAYKAALDLDPDLDVPHASAAFTGYLDLSMRLLIAAMLGALIVAVPARLGMGGLWGSLVAIGLIGAAGWAHLEWIGRFREEVPQRDLHEFVRTRPILVSIDAGAAAAGVIALVLAFLTDLATQQVGAALVVAAVAVGAGVGMVRRARLVSTDDKVAAGDD
ncbi:hypothetical protein GCM10027418_16690 [Mariniluteicoccus endophyticus]